MENECPYIGTGPDEACGASVANMAPAGLDFELYCSSEDHYRCPIGLARVLREMSAKRG